MKRNPDRLRLELSGSWSGWKIENGRLHAPPGAYYQAYYASWSPDDILQFGFEIANARALLHELKSQRQLDLFARWEWSTNPYNCHIDPECRKPSHPQHQGEPA